MDDCKSLEKQGFDYILIFSLDLSKTFDRVPHHLVISQLSKVVPSVNPYIVNLIRSFLMHRKQFVVYDNHRSSKSSNNSGEPQGTDGSPCFNLSYDDCQVTQTLATFAKFADDNTPCIGGKHGVDSANQAIGHMEWCESNNFISNNEKSKEVQIKLSHSVTIQTVHDIEITDKFKILGITSRSPIKSLLNLT